MDLQRQFRAAGQSAISAGGLKMTLCIADLAAITRGQLRLASMPPRDGELAKVRRLVLSAEDVCPGDVFWCLRRHAGNIELAFLRGALGTVAAGKSFEPWPGRFSLVVDDPEKCLERVARRWVATIREQSFVNRSELKVLQLCGPSRVDIYPPTCGRSAKGQRARRCRRQAA